MLYNGRVSKVFYSSKGNAFAVLVRGADCEHKCYIPSDHWTKFAGSKANVKNIFIGTEVVYYLGTDNMGRILNFYDVDYREEYSQKTEEFVSDENYLFKNSFNETNSETRFTDGSFTFYSPVTQIIFNVFSSIFRLVTKKISFSTINNEASLDEKGSSLDSSVNSKTLGFFRLLYNFGEKGFSLKLLSEKITNAISLIVSTTTKAFDNLELTVGKKVNIQFYYGDSEVKFEDKNKSINLNGNKLDLINKDVYITTQSFGIFVGKNEMQIYSNDSEVGLFLSKKGEITVQSKKNINIISENEINLESKKLNINSDQVSVNSSNFKVQSQNIEIADSSASLIPNKIQSTLSTLATHTHVATSVGAPTAPSVELATIPLNTLKTLVLVLNKLMNKQIIKRG